MTETHFKIQYNAWCDPERHPKDWRDDGNVTYDTKAAAVRALKADLKQWGWPSQMATPCHYRVVRVEQTVVKEFLLPPEERISYTERCRYKAEGLR